VFETALDQRFVAAETQDVAAHRSRGVHALTERD
jgi:hypothetical protein